MNRYQFTLKGLFKLTTLAALFFAAMRWMPPFFFFIAAFAAVMTGALAALAAFTLFMEALVTLAEKVFLRKRKRPDAATPAEVQSSAASAESANASVRSTSSSL